jgi:hypothetical protein
MEDAKMLSEKGSTYTDLLVREICAHLEWMATDPSRAAGECNAFYKAARSIGRNRDEFVMRTLRQMEWLSRPYTADAKEEERVR